MHLWAKASSTNVYVQNRSPHKILGNKTPEELFTGRKPQVSYLRIFGCPMYIHVSKEKSTKLEPSGRKGIFLGYSETSKAYIIYITAQRKVEISKDVTFDEDEAFIRSRESKKDEDIEEQEAPRDGIMVDTTQDKPIPEENNEMVESKRLLDPPREAAVTRERPAWLWNTLQEAKGYAAPKGSFKENKRPHKFSSYVVLMSRNIDSKPSTFEVLEYKGLCARFTTTIPSSPNHRPKPPSEHLNLDLRITLEANPRLDSQTKSSASLPKDSASQKADQIVQTLAKRYPSQILKLLVAAAAPATLLQTCAPATPAVRTNWENCSPEM
jgi:hypothetical protein